MPNKSKKHEENFSEPKGGSEPKKKSKPSVLNRQFLFIFLGLIVALSLILFFLLLPEKKETQVNIPKEKIDEINPTGDLSNLIKGYLIEYYDPPKVTFFQQTNTVYDYMWEIDDVRLGAIIKYNQNNNYINHGELTIEVTNSKELNEQTASELAQNNFTIDPSGKWNCSSLGVEATVESYSSETNSLVAEVSGTAKGPIRYLFDCTGDGIIEKDITTNTQTYTAQGICPNNATSGFVAVAREGRFAVNFFNEDTANILKCRNQWLEGNSKYEILIYNNDQLKTIRFCVRSPKSKSYQRKYCIN